MPTVDEMLLTAEQAIHSNEPPYKQANLAHLAELKPYWAGKITTGKTEDEKEEARRAVYNLNKQIAEEAAR